MSPANFGRPVRPGKSEFEEMAGKAEPLDVPDAFPVWVAVALFDAEPDAVADASWEDGAAEPPDVGATLSPEPGSLGRPCVATLAARSKDAKSSDIEERPDFRKTRMAVDYVYFHLVMSSLSFFRCGVLERTSSVAANSTPDPICLLSGCGTAGATD